MPVAGGKLAGHDPGGVAGLWYDRKGVLDLAVKNTV
mgnify:CR=1 FL=1